MTTADQQYLNEFNKRLVSLSWVDCKVAADERTLTEPRIYCATGFVIEYEGEWLWITSGHLLNDLDNKLPEMRRCIVRSQLLAGWNSENGTVTRIPFEYGECVKYFEDNDDEGADLGMIYIDSRIRRGLAAVGVQPIQDLRFPSRDYEQYLVHGLPTRLQRDEIDESTDALEYATSVMPVAFRVFPITTGTAGFPRTTHRLFYASVPAEVTLDTLDGISGGPIYALTKVGNGIIAYLAAVQNQERKASRNIAACPSVLMHEILAKGFAKIRKQLDHGTDGVGL